MIIRWEKDITFYNEIDPELLQDYFVNDILNYEDEIKKTDELLEMEAELIIQNKADLTAEILFEKFEVISEGENLIYFYEFFNLIYIMVKKNQLQNLLDFFKKMDSAAIKIFYNIPFTSGYNAFIVKVYLTFIMKFRSTIISHNVRNEI